MSRGTSQHLQKLVSEHCPSPNIVNWDLFGRDKEAPLAHITVSQGNAEFSPLCKIMVREKH